VKKPRRRKDPPNTRYIYVAKNGNDRSGDGSAEKPFKTLAAALLAMPRVVIRLSPGTYTAKGVVLPPRVTLKKVTP
jgi:hypothetical protein